MDMMMWASMFLFQLLIIGCGIVDGALNDLSSPVNVSHNVENDTDIVSFDIRHAPPIYPLGGGFGNGSIDLGGLEVSVTLFFIKIWSIQTGGPEGHGVSFYEPATIPSGFNLLGHYTTPNSLTSFAALLVAKDTTLDTFFPALKSPIDYTLIWTSKGLIFNVSKDDGDGYIWRPIPPSGYKAIGHIVTTSPNKPALDYVKCVRSDLTDVTEVDTWIWGVKMWKSSLDINVYTTKPKSRDLGVPAGTFLARAGHSDTHTLACLKMVRSDRYFAMPNKQQISTMMHGYAPWVYFHPDEQYFPSSVMWLFLNGVELHQTGRVPERVFIDGENLPKDGSVDDAFLDLPPNDKDRVKKGFLPNAIAYVHVKPALGGTFTDLAIWLYYPFNGGGKFQLGPWAIDLGRIGEHVSDWEHITLRIDNYQGVLKSVYLSQHANGKWINALEFEFMNETTRPIVYAALHGHAHYNTPDHHMHWVAYQIDESEMQAVYDEFKIVSNESVPIVKGDKFSGFGVRDDAAKSDNVMDIASRYQVMSIDYKSHDLDQQWLNYTGRWGPKFIYKFTEEVIEVTNHLPERIKALAINLLFKLPPELLGQEGPQGPKMKDSWTGDERV